MSLPKRDEVSMLGGRGAQLWRYNGAEDESIHAESYLLEAHSIDNDMPMSQCISTPRLSLLAGLKLVGRIWRHKS